MATLQEFLGSLLRAVCEAQEASNRQSAALAARSSRDPLLASFPVSRPQISEVDLRLQVAFEDLVEAAEVHGRVSQEAVGRTADAIAAAAIEEVEAALSSMPDDQVSPDSEGAARTRRRLRSEEFFGHLSGEIASVLQALGTARDAKESGWEELARGVLEQIDRHLLTNPALSQAIPSEGYLHKSLQQNLLPKLHALLDGLLRPGPCEAGAALGALQVVTDLERLRELPEHLFHQVTVRLVGHPGGAGGFEMQSVPGQSLAAERRVP